jgi:hypothetical protein
MANRKEKRRRDRLVRRDVVSPPWTLWSSGNGDAGRGGRPREKKTDLKKKRYTTGMTDGARKDDGC